MVLEDHIGDVVKKARLAAGVNSAQAAAAAQVAEPALLEFEESGKIPPQIKWGGLSHLLGVSEAKLTGLANGWLPQKVDLSIWRELRVITTTAEGLTVNAYLVWDEVTREAALFDTGWELEPIAALVQENDLTLKHLFITHTHRDHIGAITPLREKFPKLRLHSSSKNAPPDQRNRPQEVVQLGSLRISHRETPGHAEDGVTYIVGNFPEDAPFVAIVGDAIFAGSMGRGNQSWDLARSKVRENIFSLPEDTLICSGHGPLTTVGQEKKHNPLF